MALNLLERGQQIPETAALMRNKQVPLIFYRQTNIDDVVEEVEIINPDIIWLVNGLGIIKQPLLRSCRHGVISSHHGNMRKHRGQLQAFWELLDNKRGMESHYRN